MSQVFVNFHEPEVLKFRPSYKYDAGTSNWDSRWFFNCFLYLFFSHAYYSFTFSEKCRCPAWCDRILWYTESSDRIVQTLYDSIDDVKLSDHKPVVAAFQLTVRIWDYVELQKVFEEATREADKRTNEALPQISLSTTEVDFFVII